MKKKWVILGIVVAFIIIAGILCYFQFCPERSLGIEKMGREYSTYLIEEFEHYPQKKSLRNMYCEIDEKRYRAILLSERVSYNLLTQEEADKIPVMDGPYPAEKEGRHLFRKKDLGEFIGETSAAYGYLPQGLKAYHYSEFPDSNEIIIVELGDHFGYSFYIFDTPEDYVPGGPGYVYLD